MKADIYNIQNSKVGTLELPDELFGAPWRPALVEQVLSAQQANKRRPWAHAKGRGEVSGGGKKPWRQKGTGRARHGSTRSPLWRHGGKAHGPLSTRDYSEKVNKKMKQAAVASVLSRKLKNQEVKVFDQFALSAPKTKLVSEMLRGILGAAKSLKKFDVLVIPNPENKALPRAAKNLVKTKVLPADSLNVYDLMNYRYVFFEQDAIAAIKKPMSKKKPNAMKLSPIKKMIVTEKSTRLNEKGTYVFAVDPASTKNEIREALKAMYKVDAIAVRTLREKPVRKRFRNKIAFKQGGKKAMVTLKEGQKIDLQQ